MGRKLKLIILKVLFLSLFFNGIVFGIVGPNDIILVPSAKMPKAGYVEYGTMYEVYSQEGSFKVSPLFSTFLS